MGWAWCIYQVLRYGNELLFSMGQIGRLIGDPVEPQARDAYVWYAHPCAQTYPSTEINCGYSRQSKVTSMKKPNGIGD